MGMGMSCRLSEGGEKVRRPVELLTRQAANILITQLGEIFGKYLHT